MSHADNLETIKSYLNDSYERQVTTVVPKRSDLTFGNTIKQMKHAVVVYFDMRGSRKILHDATAFVSVKVHRAFLQAIVYCVENRDGHLRSFNGDGALAFFTGGNAASRAVQASMELDAYVLKMNELLPDARLDFGVGIAQGKVDVAKSGKRGEDATKQDLIWIGLPVYVTVELGDYARSPKNIWITHKVRTAIGNQNHLNVVYDGNGESMWKKVEKSLKSVGRYDVRNTTFYKPIL